jgi:hypothetical protein
MFASLRHTGLKLLLERDDPSKLKAEHVNRLRLILSAERHRRWGVDPKTGLLLDPDHQWKQNL